MCSRTSWAGALLAACLLIASPLAAAGRSQPEANPTGVAVLEFQHRLDAYLKLREKAVDGVPKLKETPSPSEISAREAALGAAIRAARRGARRGDIVGPVDGLVRRVVRSDWRKRSAADQRALALEIPKVTQVVVNTTYPTTLPLATVPPTLLQELPRLPEGLQYRLMGRALVLHDVGANLIVDLVEKALPSR
jgi:hypothetical protein